MMKLKKLFLIGMIGVAVYSCVPLKQFDDLKKRSEGLQDSNQLLKEENRELTVAKNESEGQTATYRKKYDVLEKQLSQISDQRDELKEQERRFSKSQEELEKQIDLLKEGSSDEISKLLNELQILQNDLQDREDKVRNAEDILNRQKQQLNQAQEALALQEQKLKATETALKEEQSQMMALQDALDKQKTAVSSLKDKLNHSLRGFYNQGLTVYEKNGKVYVSLEEQLIFKTGSYNLDPKGKEALKSLSEVLANNPDINIMVEGHTDDVPLAGSGQVKDNWDLSVMRATAVVKIILNNSAIKPQRITASGRGEFVPIDEGKTAEARMKNRRTEIILTPDLSKVFEILQSN